MLAVVSGIFLGYLNYRFLFFTNIKLFFILLLVVSAGVFIIRSTHLAFIVFLGTLPLGKNIYLPFSLPPSLILFIFLFFAVVYSYNKEMKKQFIEQIRTPLDISLFLFLVVIIFSVLQSKYIPQNPYIIKNFILNYPWIKSITKIILVCGYIALFYVSVCLLNSKEKIIKCVKYYAIFLFLFSLLGLAMYVIYLVTGTASSLLGYSFIVDIPSDLPRLRGVEQEPLYFGFYLLTILPVLYSILLSNNPDLYKDYNFASIHTIIKSKRSILFWLSGVITVALILTQSRSALLGLFFSTLSLLYMYRDKKEEGYNRCKNIVISWYTYCKNSMTYFLTEHYKKTIVFGVILILILGSYTVLYREAVWEKSKYIINVGVIAPTIGSFEEGTGKHWSTKARFIAYDYAINAFRQHPWLGIGYENFNFYSGQKYYYGLYNFNMNWPEVNNYPLKVLAELGVIGFLAFLFFLGTLFYSLFSALKKTKDPYFEGILKGYIASFVGIAVLLLFSSSITRSYLWVSLGIAMATVKLCIKEKEENKEGNKVEGPS